MNSPETPANPNGFERDTTPALPLATDEVKKILPELQGLCQRGEKLDERALKILLVAALAESQTRQEQGYRSIT